MEQKPDKIGEALAKFDMGIHAASIHGATAVPEKHVNDLPERLVDAADAMAKGNAAAAVGAQEYVETAKGAIEALDGHLIAKQEKAAGWVTTPVDQPEELLLNEDMKIED